MTANTQFPLIEHDSVADLVANSPYTDLVMPSVWGSYEGGLTDMWRIFEDSMTFYNYPNKDFQDYPEGHSWGFWRATTDELLIQLFPGPAVISILEQQNSVTLKVYPNPASSKIYLKGERSGIVRIMNCSGKLLRSWEFNEEGGLDLSGVPPGLYWLIFDDQSVPLVIST